MVAGRPTLRYQVVISLLVVLMVSALLSSLSGFWRLEADQNDLLLFSVAAVAFGWLSWRYPWAAVALLTLGSLGTIAGISLGYLPAWDLWLQRLALELAEFAQNWRELQLEASFGPAVGVVFLALTAFGAGMLIVPEALTKGSTFWSIAFGTLVFGTEWAWYYDAASLHFIGFAILAFLVWTLGQAALRDARWESTGRKVGYRSHVATPVATVLVVGMLATILPTHWEPLDLGAWGEKAQEAFPVLKRLRGAGVGGGSGRFSLRSTGFSPNLGALGGPVTLDHSVALHVTADKALTETVYLRGATFRAYTGTTWTPGSPAEVKVAQDGVMPTYFSSDVLRDYVTLAIKPAVNMGFTVFNAWEPMSVNGLKSAYRADADGNVWAQKAINRNATYEVISRWPRYSAEQIRAIPDIPPGDGFEPYLVLPETVPDRVGRRAEQVAAGAAHPYDKALAVERYLQGLPYELNTPPTPSGQDFVDYFLFELEEGYCVYSASAMVVLLRELGIPARLVEGFALPPSAQYTEDASGKRTYSVLNSMAHAWVEAYFTGYGWVTFDPTPRGDLPVIDRSTPAPQRPQTTPDDQNIPSNRTNDPLPTDNPEDFMEDFGNTGGGAAVKAVAQEWPWILAALTPVLALLAVAWRRLKLQERIVATEGRAVVQEVWTKTGWLLSLFDAGPRPHETAREYADTIGKRWAPLHDPAIQVADEYTAARYSPPERAVPGEVSDHARTLWEKANEVLFDKFGWRRYLWRRLWTRRKK